MILDINDVVPSSELFRDFFAGIDYVIYGLINWILESIFIIADLSVNVEIIQTLYKRIYVILAVFMVFKLSFSFIQYLVSPDKMNDKEQGVGKLISRVVVMLVLIVALPLLFFPTDLVPADSNGNKRTILNTLQSGVLETLPKIIFGSSNTENLKYSVRSNGEKMATIMLKSFYYPNECAVSDGDADKLETCRMNEIKSLDMFRDTIMSNASSAYGGVYDYNYQWPLSTVAGILLVIILLGVCIDVGIRTFKLIILQAIAPIPVMSYIDPKSSKDGAFGSWLKTYISTYVDVFIKIAVIYLVLMLLSELTQSGSLFSNFMTNGEGFLTKGFVMAFLILALFKFAKDAPKFIKDALGIKDSGGGGGFMGKAIAGLGGAAAGFAGGLMAGGLSGGLSGAMQGASGAAQAAGSGKSFNAYATARDDIAKLKTGNQHAKGGIAGRLQTGALEAAGRRTARRSFGLTPGTLNQMKARSIELAQKASDAKYFSESFDKGNAGAISGFLDSHRYADIEEYIHEGGLTGTGGTYYDTEGNQYNANAALHKISDDRQAVASVYSADYDDVKNAAKAMNVKPTWYEKYSAKGRVKSKTDIKDEKIHPVREYFGEKKAHGKGGFDER